MYKPKTKKKRGNREGAEGDKGGERARLRGGGGRTGMADLEPRIAVSETGMGNSKTAMGNPETAMGNPETAIDDPETAMSNPETAICPRKSSLRARRP